ncbi:MAG: vitamin K epoxide reductase family protein [candidate division WWE3 bacterium]|nr:vitamin K epoxide reductase family protein [candidate division WWE3 bacterium]
MTTISKVLTACGFIGLLVSTIITIDRIKILSNPNFVPICDLNPFISCGSVNTTAQASIFGFPNSFLGIIGFAAVFGLGLYLLTGRNLKPSLWKLLNLGLLVAVLFTHWLAYQSLYVIQALCTYCMVVWAMTIATFITITRYNLLVENLKVSFLKDLLAKHSLILILSWYAFIVGLVLQHFWYYWRTLIGV